MEAELLKKLHEAQKAERDDLGCLESAMVDASIPKHMRRGGEQSQIKEDEVDGMSRDWDGKQRQSSQNSFDQDWRKQNVSSALFTQLIHITPR